MNATMARLQSLLPRPTRGPLPLSAPQRRIYILPSRFGLLFGLATLFLLLGALNYNNNPAILLGLLLGSAALASSVMTVRHLARLRVVAFKAGDVHAGEAQACRLVLEPAPTRRRGRSPNRAHGHVRAEVVLRHEAASTRALPDVDGRIHLHWRWPSVRRGRRALGRVRLASEYPLGLFRAWCDLEPEVSALVFPSLETPLPAWPDNPQSQAGTPLRRQGTPEEWYALREFQRGDGLREIAWKASARHDRWLVTESRAGQDAPALEFGLDQVAHLEREHGIQRLAAWVVAADASHQPWRLRLAGTDIGPDAGNQQRRLALGQLAELP
ncbi:MAG: DUF58 domain-containing protein [Xanthomonadales bacterium]|nr:DUF58 domain-containing protein [Xanthomonadales bacterium]